MLCFVQSSDNKIKNYKSSYSQLCRGIVIFDEMHWGICFSPGFSLIYILLYYSQITLLFVLYCLILGIKTCFLIFCKSLFFDLSFVFRSYLSVTANIFSVCKTVYFSNMLYVIIITSFVLDKI